MTDATTRKPNLRDQAKAATAAKVLETARVTFATAGYEKATIRSIAQTAGVSTGAIFANYPDKATLYQAAYGHAPISPEIGRAALRALRALTVDLGEGDMPDMVAAGERLTAHARDVLELAGFPPLPEGQPDPSESALVDVMQWALEVKP